MEKLKTYTDERGALTIVEEGQEIPFAIQRAFWIYNVPEGAERGWHANSLCYEYLVAVGGSVDVTLEDSNGRAEYCLDSKEKGLLVPPNTWAEFRNFSKGAVLLALASHTYDPDTYINSYDEFKMLINKREQ